MWQLLFLAQIYSPEMLTQNLGAKKNPQPSHILIIVFHFHSVSRVNG